MAVPNTLSIDISGEWSPRQADDVIDALHSELGALGMTIEKLDITCLGSNQRVVLQVICRRHGIPIWEDSVREECLQESK